MSRFLTLIRKFYAIIPAVVAMWLLSSCASTTPSASRRPDLIWEADGSQLGKASWYDDHGSRTANGEIFNMYAFTAAHPSIALNSIVDVTNLGNGKTIRVRVNDRLPPIHKGRVIDLSKSAFNRLDNLQVGLMDVEVRVVTYGNNKYKKTEQSAAAGQLYLARSSKGKAPKQTVSREAKSKTL